MKLRFGLLFLLFYLLPLLSLAADQETGFSAQITLSSSSLTVNELLSVTVTITHPAGYNIDINKMRARLLQYSGMVEPPFVLSSEKIVTSNDTGKTIIFSLKPQLEGIFFLSLYDILFSSQGQQKPSKTLLSDIFQVEVLLPNRNEEPVPLYPLLSLSSEFPISVTEENRQDLLQNPFLASQEQTKISILLKEKKLPWIHILGAIFLLFLIPILRLQPKKERKITKKKQRMMTSKELIATVDLLETQYLVNGQSVDSYYSELSTIIKHYIEDTYGISATAQTSLELAEALRGNPQISQEQKRIFKHIFETSDQVKFAQENPDPDTAKKISQILRDLISV